MSQAPSTADSLVENIYDLYSAETRRSIPQTPQTPPTLHPHGSLPVAEEAGGMGKILRSNSTTSQPQIITRLGTHRSSSGAIKPAEEPKAPRKDTNVAKLLPPPPSWDREDDGTTCSSVLARHHKKITILLVTLLLTSVLLLFFLFPRSINISVVDIKPAQEEQYKFYTAEGKMGVLSDSIFVCRITNNNYLPLRVKRASIQAYWRADSQRIFFGNGSVEGARVPPRSFNEVRVPLAIDYIGDLNSDVVFQDYLGRCAGPTRTPVELELALKFEMRNGAVGVQRSFNYTLRWPCPAELSVENLGAIFDASGYPQDSVRVKRLGNKSIKELVRENKASK